MDTLAHGVQSLELAAAWEDEAGIIERSHSDSPAARTLRRCASSLRQLASDLAPDEVPLTAIRDRTGWSESWLLQRAHELEAEGKARKRGGSWMVDRAAALAIPIKRGHRVQLVGDDMDELSDRILAVTTDD